MTNGVRLPSRPYFTVQVGVRQCAVDIRVNDIPVFVDRRPGEVWVELPVCLSVMNGRNTLTVNAGALPEAEVFEEHARVSVSLFVRTAGAARDTRQLLTGIVFRPVVSQEVAGVLAAGKEDPTIADSPAGDEPVERSDLGPGRVAVERGIELQIPHAQWAWLEGPVLKTDDATSLTLLDEYRAFHRALGKGDSRLVRAMTALRARELLAAYHLQDEEAAHDKLGFLRRLKDTHRKLDPLRNEGMNLEIFGGGRLARIVDDDGDGPISFLVGSGRVVEYVKVMYCKDARGRWAMVR